jgi:hypothetical protein
MEAGTPKLFHPYSKRFSGNQDKGKKREEPAKAQATWILCGRRVRPALFPSSGKGEKNASGQQNTRMKNISKVALATIALAGMSGAAHADLNAQGEVGLPLNPTAQIPQTGGFRLQGNYYDNQFGGDKISLYSLSGAIRAGATTPLEISANVNRSNGGASSKDTKFGLGAKYLFSREGDAIGVRTAAGIGYNEFDILKNYHAYVVASKYFGTVTGERVPITGHLGLRYDRYQALGITSNRPSIYAGAEVPLTRSGEFQVLGEIGSKVVSGGGSPYSLGVRFRPKQQPFGATVGIQRTGVFDSKGRIFAQVGYTFGGL